MIRRRSYLRRSSKPIQRKRRPRSRRTGHRANLARLCAELWSKMVKERDGYCCFRCGSLGIDAHHVYGKKAYPAVRYELANGITLCRLCHVAVHSLPVSSLFLLQEKLGSRFDEISRLTCSTRKLDLAEVRTALEAA